MQVSQKGLGPESSISGWLTWWWERKSWDGPRFIVMSSYVGTLQEAQQANKDNEWTSSSEGCAKQQSWLRDDRDFKGTTNSRVIGTGSAILPLEKARKGFYQ
jgi:hypothetical protein